jgi:hypothetical protein
MHMQTNQDFQKGSYIFRGRLCGYICDECPEPLANVRVRLYRSRAQDNLASLAVAAPKDTFAILSDDEVKAKEKYLIAEAETDADGNFQFVLGREQKYDGGAFEVDVYCGTVPHLKPGPKPPKPLQFSITTLQPQWRPYGEASLAAWEYCLSKKYWCAVRARFGAWTICGRVTVCSTGDPVQGLTVRAFDADWLQDDALGAGVTNADGKFRIDYATADFQRTPLSPLLNFELVGGPDIYFKIEASDGTVWLNEPRSRARKPDRENVGHCFCVDLCIKEKPVGTTPHPTTIPLFTKVGSYSVEPADGAFTAEGRTTSGNYAFTDTIPLIGLLPDGDSPDALEYHFRVAAYELDGVTLGPLSDVGPDRIATTVIGALEYWDFDSVNNVWKLRAADYYAKNTGASITIHRPAAFGGDIVVPVNVDPDAGGWIKVPRENDLTIGGTGRFVGGSNVTLINFPTTALVNESFDISSAPALKAGENVPGGVKSRLYAYKLVFEARKVGVVGLFSTNDLHKIAVSNTHYKQLRHPDWAGGVVTLRCVALLDIAQLSGPGGGCNAITDHVNAQYTAYHPALAEVTVYFEGNPPLPPGAPLTLNSPPVATEVASTLVGHDFDSSGINPCAYILWLQVALNLTSGWGRIPDGVVYDHIAFCKK